MKLVRYECDGCGGKVPTSCDGGKNRLQFRMVTNGYGMLDGDHNYKAHVCSSECGLALVKKWIAEIEAPEP